jgi:sugar O-acyltransferase (sialic acid O-acetyltransferase NeuD family)
MTVPIVVVGAGGFGRETLDVVDAINRFSGSTVFEVLGVVDSAPSVLNQERLQARGIPWIGTPEAWLKSDCEALYMIGVGNPVARRRVFEQFRSAGRTAATLIHPSASIGSAFSLGEGSIVCGGAQISTNVRTGVHVHINPNATIGHDSVLGDFVSINPAATVSGSVHIGAQTLVGAGAVVLQELTIGAQCTIGASACVTRDVEDSRTVVGVPAR